MLSRFIRFLKLVEIQTKVASMIPFVLGTLFAWYRYQRLDVKNFLFMFISLICFDMATTAINNYYDFKKAIKTHGYGYETHNAIVKYQLKESTVLALIVMLVGTAIAFGLLLFFHTNVVVLVVGALSFVVGILYSFGPIPISRMPLGEIFSGFFMGFVIVFLAAFIHNPELVTLTYAGGVILVNVNLLEVFLLFLVSIPTMAGIANIMLANNICDMDDDIQNRRYTLPIYIGRDAALWVFRLTYYISYVDVIVLVVAQVLPVHSLLVLVTLFPVQKNIQTFQVKQTKKDTFILAVKNFVIMNCVQLVALGIAGLV